LGLLIIDPGLKLWGSERALLSTLDSVAANVDRVVLMAPPQSELLTAVEDKGLTLLARPIANLHRRPAPARLGFIWSVFAACLRHGIERIHLNQAGPARLVNIVAQRLGIPLVVHVRLRDDIARCAGLKASARAPITLIFVSEGMLDLYPGDAQSAHKTLLTAYDPYPIGDGPPPATAGEDTPFICVGRLAAQKGQDRLIKAIGLGRRQGLELKTRLLGADVHQGAYEGELRDLAKAEGVADLVNFGGFVADVAPLMARSRFLILPSDYETLGRVIFEAWDAGLMPICAADSGGAAEVTAASGGGLIYEPNTPAGICAAMAQALRLSEDERLDKVTKGREWAKLNLSVEAYQEKVRSALFPKARRSSP
jgi:glycosyltransferase involved in cell wall biosynthesis